MSESSTKFLNKDGEVNSIVLDPSNNSAVVKNDDGDILVKYTNGTWEPTVNAPVDILRIVNQVEFLIVHLKVVTTTYLQKIKVNFLFTPL